MVIQRLQSDASSEDWSPRAASSSDQQAPRRKKSRRRVSAYLRRMVSGIQSPKASPHTVCRGAVGASSLSPPLSSEVRDRMLSQSTSRMNGVVVRVAFADDVSSEVHGKIARLAEQAKVVLASDSISSDDTVALIKNMMNPTIRLVSGDEQRFSVELLTSFLLDLNAQDEELCQKTLDAVVSELSYSPRWMLARLCENELMADAVESRGFENAGRLLKGLLSIDCMHLTSSGTEKVKAALIPRVIADPKQRDACVDHLKSRGIIGAISTLQADQLDLMLTLLDKTDGLDLNTLEVQAVDDKKPMSLYVKLVQSAVTMRSVELADVLFKYSDNPAMAHRDVLLESARQNQDAFTLELLDLSGDEERADLRAEISAIALEGNNLGLLSKTDSQYVDRFIEKLRENPEKIEHTLYSMVLNSSYPEAVSFLAGISADPRFGEHVETIKGVEAYMQKGGCLIGRFPQPEHQVEMHRTYGSAHVDYVAQQRAYGGSRHEAARAMADELSASKSSGQPLKLSDVYTSLQGGSDRTRWRDEEGVFDTPIAARYRMFTRFAVETLKETGSPIIRYEDPRAHKSEQLTCLFLNSGPNVISWMHTSGADTEGWLDRMGMSRDFDSIVKMDIDPNNPADVKRLQQKIARFYWKGAQLAPTERGNAQTMLEMHYILYAIHGIQPPPVSKELSMPDCVALSMPIHKFVGEYYEQCWDFPPTT